MTPTRAQRLLARYRRVFSAGDLPDAVFIQQLQQRCLRFMIVGVFLFGLLMIAQLVAAVMGSLDLPVVFACLAGLLYQALLIHRVEAIARLIDDGSLSEATKAVEPTGSATIRR